MNIDFFGESITGRRKNNEDSIISKELTSNTYLFAVADGMGGGSYGEIASKLAIEETELFLSSAFSGGLQVEKLKEALFDCFEFVQQRIGEYIEENPDYGGMGTTLSVLVIHNGQYVWGNIGDSRIYIYDDNSLRLLTKDHTYLQDLTDEGTEITENIVANYSHLLTRCISGSKTTADIFPENASSEILKEKEGFLLCSDGLILDKREEKNHKSYHKIILKERNLKKQVERLISYAYENHSNDNISAIVVSTQADNNNSLQKIKNHKRELFMIFSIVVILAIFLLSYKLVSHDPAIPIVPEQDTLSSQKTPNYTDSLTKVLIFKDSTNALIKKDSLNLADSMVNPLLIIDTLHHIDIAKDSISRIESMPQEWEATSIERQISKNKEIYIYWNLYRTKDKLITYRIGIRNSEKKIVYKHTAKPVENFLKLKKRLKRPGTYIVQFIAITDKDTIVGNKLQLDLLELKRQK